MNSDPELERWRSLWQVDVQAPLDLREKAQRQIRFMRLLVAGEAAVTVLMGGAAIAWALNSGESSVRFLAIWIWMALLVAWLFRFLNDRGNWTGTAPDTEAFLHLWSRRLRARLRDVKFSRILYIVQLTFCCVWVYHVRNSHTPLAVWAFLSSAPLILVWIGTLLFFAWTVRYSRRTRAELRYVEQFSQGVEGEPCTVDVPLRSRRSRSFVLVRRWLPKSLLNLSIGRPGGLFSAKTVWAKEKCGHEGSTEANLLDFPFARRMHRFLRDRARGLGPR